jgi:putative transposase
MRKPRMKVPAGTDGIYHCYSRVVDGRFIFKTREKEHFLNMMWRVADFLGIQVLNYSLMSNHYHQILLVPGTSDLDNDQLLQRLKTYYGETSNHYQKFLKAMKKGDKSPELLRPKYIRRMADLSEFEKILKQGFSSWYNRHNDRKGTLWMGRFGSTITEDSPQSAMVMAAYVDLNPVRAGLVNDPEDYPYCGYAVALEGNERCRKGIMRILQIDSWDRALETYRGFLMANGRTEVTGKSVKMGRKFLLKTLEEGGNLSISELLRLRVRPFTDGLALGSEEFVEKLFHQHRSHFGEKRKSGARPIRAVANSQLNCLRDLKNSVFS